MTIYNIHVPLTVTTLNISPYMFFSWYRPEGCFSNVCKICVDCSFCSLLSMLSIQLAQEKVLVVDGNQR